MFGSSNYGSINRVTMRGFDAGKIVFCVFYKSLHYIIQFSYLRHNCSHQLTFKVAVQNLIIV